MQPRVSADAQLNAAERLLGCSTTPLPPIAISRQGAGDRIELLLNWIIGVAGASNGVILLNGDDGRLQLRACVGIEPAGLGETPAGTELLSFGLIVHSAEIADHGGPDRAACCDKGLVDTQSRMALALPLEVAGRVIGAVQVGFRELRPLEQVEIRRLGMIADHIASASEAERLAHESAARLAEIQRVSAVLEEIDRMKGDFLSMISHELRTPLTAIIGYTDLLLRQIHGTLNERQAHHQQAVKKAANRLLALVNDLLDLNRLEGGHVVLNLDDLPLSDAVKQAVSQCASGAEQRGVELRLDLPVAPVAVHADSDRLQQVLTNLLDNAIKFTPTGGSVTVRVKQCDDDVTVSVVDTGVGVPPEQLHRIWDRFHQADSSTRRQFGGTGLGLAIVRHLVELHGGSVSVASAGPNEGSTFSFTLPAADVDARQSDSPPVTPGEASPRPGPSRTVLIVDDEPDNREVITSIVHDVLGHIVLAATNGREALEQAERQPDLVLLDLRMPGMSGFEVARALKQRPATAEIPIIAITALDDEDDRREASDAGCIGCVTKPFSEESLATAVTSVLVGARRTANR
jgi:signal transduction histidine kinase/ActR/RegA family two-component response regulator